MSDVITSLRLNNSHRGKKLFNFNYGIAIDGDYRGNFSESLQKLKLIATDFFGHTPMFAFSESDVRKTKKVGWSYKFEYGREFVYFKNKEDMEKVLTYYILSEKG